MKILQLFFCPCFFAYGRSFFLQGGSRRCLQALRFFLQVGSRRPPAPPAVPPALWYFWLARALWRWAGPTHVAQSFTPLPPFMAKAGLCIAPRLPHPGEASPGTPSLLSSRFVASLGTLCRQTAPTKLPRFPKNSHSLPQGCKSRSLSSSRIALHQTAGIFWLFSKKIQNFFHPL